MITLCSTINVVAVEEWSKLSLLFYNWSYTFVTELPPYSASPSTPNAAIASFLDRLSLAWHSHNTRKTKFALMTLQLSSLVAEACCLSLFQAKARMPYCVLSNTWLRFSCSKDWLYPIKWKLFNSNCFIGVTYLNFKNTIAGMCFSRRTILILRSSSAARKEAGFLLLWLIFFPAFLRLLFNAINYGTAAESWARLPPARHLPALCCVCGTFSYESRAMCGTLTNRNSYP